MRRAIKYVEVIENKTTIYTPGIIPATFIPYELPLWTIHVNIASIARTRRISNRKYRTSFLKMCQASRMASSFTSKRYENGAQRHRVHRNLLDVAKDAMDFVRRAIRFEMRLDKANER